MKRKMKRIAILDDGINEFITEMHCSNHLQNCRNEICHGSLVVATIEKYYTDEKIYYIYDVYNKKNQEKAIIKALWHCMKNNVDIVVMSFTIPKSLYRIPIEILLGMLYKRRIIVVASDYNRTPLKGYPAFSKYTIGVGNQDIKPANVGKKGLQYGENIKPEFVKYGDEYKLFSGTSKANAIIAARLAEYGLNYKKKQVENVECSKRKKNTEIIIICKKILNTEDNIKFFKGDYDLYTVEQMILSILKRFNMEKTCLKMKFEDMQSIETVADYIIRNYG